ncbi:hypothetical protein ACFL54_03540, partial [Planctomycetota bacterium]
IEYDPPRQWTRKFIYSYQDGKLKEMNSFDENDLPVEKLIYQCDPNGNWIEVISYEYDKDKCNETMVAKWKSFRTINYYSD